jgi:hypothetical protein
VDKSLKKTKRSAELTKLEGLNLVEVKDRKIPNAREECRKLSEDNSCQKNRTESKGYDEDQTYIGISENQFMEVH